MIILPLLSPLDNRAMSEIVCVRERTFTLDGRTVAFVDLRCKDPVLGDVQVTAQTCGAYNQGTVMHIGFGSAHNFITQIEVCYKQNTASTMFTYHLLYGNAVFEGCVYGSASVWRVDGTPNVVHDLLDTRTKDEYSSKSQKKRFTAISPSLGSRIRGSVQLVKGHMTPRCDALFPTWKSATMFYINAVPTWSRVNGANWVRVEAMVRNQAKAMQRTLQVYTGVHQVLAMDGVTNMHLLSNGMMEVPKWMWKILRDPQTGYGIALVTLNNMFATEHEQICVNIGGTSHWGDHYSGPDGFSDYSRGYTIVCDVNELMRVVPDIPRAAATTGVLMCVDRPVVLNG